MKKITQKFFLLAIGMILSVGAYAQDGEIKHKFPRFDFTYESGGNTIEAYVPAWDVRSWKSGKHWGAIRFQVKSITDTKVENEKTIYEFDSKLVSRGAIRKDNSNYVDIPKGTMLTFKDKTGTTKSMKAEDISYGHFVLGYKEKTGEDDDRDFYDDPEDNTTWWNPFDYTSNNFKDYLVFSFTSTGSYCVDTKDYTIIDEWDGIDGNKYKASEIDIFAFRNFSVSGDSTTYWFRPKSVTIPASIKKIGQGAFFSNLLTQKVTFASDNMITEIPAQCFMNLYRVEEITFSKNVASIGGASLGGCKLLNRIIFTSNEAPELKTFTRDGGTYDFITATGTASPTVPSKCIMEVPLHSAKKYVDKDELYKKFPMSSKFTMNKKSITYCSDLPFTFKQYDGDSWSDGDVKVYYVKPNDVKINEGKIDVTEIIETKKIPTEFSNNETGHFGVILSGEANKTYDIFYPNNVISDVLQVADNCLEGVLEQTPIDVSSYYLYYVLTDGKFLPVKKSGKLNANRAFVMIEVPEGMDPEEAKQLTISLPEESGITDHEYKSVRNDAYYTLHGIQVKQPQKGIFIKNGKKYVIK